MNKLRCLLVGSAVTVSGCVWSVPSLTESAKPPEPAPKAEARQAKPHALVTPDQVDEHNAREKAALLRHELELDEQDR